MGIHYHTLGKMGENSGRDFYKITLAAMIAPLMYLVVFGHGDPDHITTDSLI